MYAGTQKLPAGTCFLHAGGYWEQKCMPVPISHQLFLAYEALRLQGTKELVGIRKSPPDSCLRSLVATGNKRVGRHPEVTDWNSLFACQRLQRAKELISTRKSLRTCRCLANPEEFQLVLAFWAQNLLSFQNLYHLQRLKIPLQMSSKKFFADSHQPLQHFF